MVLVLLAGGCVTRGDTRRLHYVGDRLVASDPPPPFAYEAYLRARLAIERSSGPARSPDDLERAHEHILDALRWDPSSAQLWTTRAEIEWLAGDFAAAEASLAQALELQPGYAAARELLARVRSRGDATTAAGLPSARTLQ